MKCRVQCWALRAANTKWEEEGRPRQSLSPRSDLSLLLQAASSFPSNWPLNWVAAADRLELKVTCNKQPGSVEVKIPFSSPDPGTLQPVNAPFSCAWAGKLWSVLCYCSETPWAGLSPVHRGNKQWHGLSHSLSLFNLPVPTPISWNHSQNNNLHKASLLEEFSHTIYVVEFSFRFYTQYKYICLYISKICIPTIIHNLASS